MKVLQAVDGQILSVPGDAWLLKADFAPQGSDLLLTGPDGAQVLIRDFYNLETPPDLMTDTGAVISADLALALAGPVAPGQLAMAGDQLAQAAESIGRVEATDGLVEAVRIDGTKVSLSKGDDIFQGDTLITAKGAAIGITFIDDTTFSLGEEGRMVIDEMVYDAGAQEGQFSANLVQGVFSFVSGQIAKTSPDGMTVTTPVATIGIRGTKVAGRAAQEGSDNTISLLPETDAQGNQIIGELAVTNQGGTVTLNSIGATVSMSSAFQAPPSPVTLSPQQLQQNYGAALTTLSTTAAAKANADAAEDAQAAEQAEADAQAAEAEAEAAQAEADAAQAEAEAAAAEAEASGDPEAIAAAQAAQAEADAKAAQAEAAAAEAESAAAEAQAAAAEAEATQAQAEQANVEMQAQAEAFAAVGGPPAGDSPTAGDAPSDGPAPDAPPPQGDAGDAPTEGDQQAGEGDTAPPPEPAPLFGGTGDDIFGDSDPEPLISNDEPLFIGELPPPPPPPPPPVVVDPVDLPPPPEEITPTPTPEAGTNNTPVVNLQNVAIHSGSSLSFTNATSFDNLVTNSFQAGASSLGDIDNDGDMDFIMLGYDSVAGSATSSTYVGINDGNGIFTTSSAISNNLYMSRMATGDVNGDGNLDIVFAENSATAQPIYAGDGAGGFSALSQNNTIHTTGGTTGGNNVELADLNGDGKLDMFVTVDSGNKVFLNAQNGDAEGQFTDTGQSLSTAKTAQSYRGVALGDIDGDGDIDAVTGSWAEAGDVWKNDGAGTFTSHQVLSTISSSAGNGVDLGDLDGDGDLDLFVFNRGTSVANRALLNDGNGTFSDTGQNLGALSGSDAIRQNGKLVDIDGDGDLDAISATDGQMEIFLNDGSANFTQSSLGVGSGWSTQVQPGDLNGDGTTDVLVANYATGSHILTNDLPILSAQVAKGQTFTFEKLTFGVTDADNPAASTLSFNVSSIPANGSLKLNGAALAPGGTFTQADVIAGNVTYLHDGTATTTDSFQFTVSDGQGGVTATKTFNMGVTISELIGGFGKDSVTLTTAQSSSIVDLGAGTDSLTLANASNSVSVSNTETITGGTGDDTITVTGTTAATLTGGGGADTFNLSGASAAQTLRYTTSTDGATTQDSLTGRDIINGFTLGTDKIGIAGTLASAIDDVGTADGILTWTTGAADFTNTHEAMYVADTTNNFAGQMAQSGLPTLLANLMNAVGVTTATGDDGLVLYSANLSGTGYGGGIFHFEENGTTLNNVTTDELTYIGTIDSTVISSSITSSVEIVS